MPCGAACRRPKPAEPETVTRLKTAAVTATTVPHKCEAREGVWVVLCGVGRFSACGGEVQCRWCLQVVLACQAAATVGQGRRRWFGRLPSPFSFVRAPRGLFSWTSFVPPLSERLRAHKLNRRCPPSTLLAHQVATYAEIEKSLGNLFLIARSRSGKSWLLPFFLRSTTAWTPRTRRPPPTWTPRKPRPRAPASAIARAKRIAATRRTRTRRGTAPSLAAGVGASADAAGGTRRVTRECLLPMFRDRREGGTNERLTQTHNARAHTSRRVRVSVALQR